MRQVGLKVGPVTGASCEEEDATVPDADLKRLSVDGAGFCDRAASGSWYTLACVLGSPATRGSS